MRGRLFTLLFSFVVLGATAWLFITIPKGFFPTEDTGFLMASTEARRGYIVRADGRAISSRSLKVIAKNPYVARISPPQAAASRWWRRKYRDACSSG